VLEREAGDGQGEGENRGESDGPEATRPHPARTWIASSTAR